MLFITIFLNKNINTFLLAHNDKKFLIFYSKVYFIKYTVQNSVNIFFNKNSRTLTISSKGSFLSKNLIEKYFKELCFSLGNYYQKKIKFSGKSYKIKKTQNYFDLEFNKSHKELVFYKNFFFKKLKKNKMLLQGSNRSFLNTANNLIVNIRKVSPFTQRGLRGSRCILKKKVGKKSS